MIFVGAGTVINVLAIVVGSIFGIFIGHKLTQKTRDLVTSVLGLVTILGAASALTDLWSSDYVSALPQGWPLLTVLAALLLGGILGSWWRLEDRLESVGESLRRRFGASGESTFVEGFVSASLLFVIGPLAILGSISDGMSQGIDQLILKSSLDFFAALAFASTLGWGVAVSALPVALYQGLWTLIGLFLGTIMAGYQIAAMTVVGGCMLICISLRLLRITSIAVGNLLPALFIAPMIALAAHSFL